MRAKKSHASTTATIEATEDRVEGREAAPTEVKGVEVARGRGSGITDHRETEAREATAPASQAMGTSTIHGMASEIVTETISDPTTIEMGGKTTEMRMADPMAEAREIATAQDLACLHQGW